MKLVALLIAILAFSPLMVKAEEAATAAPAHEVTVSDETSQDTDSLKLNVADVQDVVSYNSPSDKAYIESMLPFSIEQEARSWVKKTLIPAGQENMLRVEITEASVKESSFEGEKRFFGLFNGPKMSRYEMVLAADIKVYGTQSLLPVGQVQVKAEQSGTIESDAAILNHEKLLRSLADKLIADFAVQTSDLITKNMGDYIVSQ